uniref:SgcJ/EcaC family oxidoreductase n=1 Tax=Nonomuraea pusilla TaxID=46177 RepID=UPI0006E3C115|nr:SgcJ/EcaC family oxidoreductase [Nonomuraea pusilla]
MSETAIRNLLARMTETWNAGDSAAYAGLFTDDADYITFFGLRLTGRQAIEEVHRGVLAAGIRLAGGGGDGGETRIRLLTDDVGLVVSGGSSSVNGEPAPGRASVVTMTALRTPDGWRFASFQNTRVTRVPTPPADGRPSQDIRAGQA